MQPDADRAHAGNPHVCGHSHVWEGMAKAHSGGMHACYSGAWALWSCACMPVDVQVRKRMHAVKALQLSEHTMHIKKAEFGLLCARR